MCEPEGRQQEPAIAKEELVVVGRTATTRGGLLLEKLSKAERDGPEGSSLVGMDGAPALTSALILALTTLQNRGLVSCVYE